MRRYDLGGILIGLIILGVGAYFLLRNTFSFAIPDLNWDQIWPLFVVAVGVSFIWNSWHRSNSNRP